MGYRFDYLRGVIIKELTVGNLPPSKVFNIVNKFSENLLTKIKNDYDCSIVVVRGGNLLKNSLVNNNFNVLELNPKKNVLDDFSNFNRILLCDTLTETGNTLDRIISELETKNKKVEIDIMSIFTTQAAVDRFSEHKFCFEHVCNNPYVIPYDFGEVAKLCNLA